MQEQELIDQLEHNSSARRRTAAKKLRKLKNIQACSKLLFALKKELNDSRTWETQYHMIMALGESGCSNSLDFLYSISQLNLDNSMILVATGDAITRLENDEGTPFYNIKKWLQQDSKYILEGAFRAIAILHLVPPNNLTKEIISYVSKKDNEELLFWAIAASPGWKGKHIEDFLKSHSSSPILENKKAALAALKNEYLTWKYL